MWRIFTAVLLTVGSLVVSCDQIEEKPKMQKSLVLGEWLITGYLPAAKGDLKVSPIEYRINFINDSTFILNLDINRIVGKFSATPDGYFRVNETKQTNSCCDSDYALQLAGILLDTRNYRVTQAGVSLFGTGEIFLKEGKKTNL